MKKLAVAVGVAGIALLGGTVEMPWFQPKVVEASVDRALGKMPGLLSADASAGQARTELNRQRLIIDVIQPYFYQVPGALHEVSSERQKRVEQVEDWLLPHEDTLLRMLTASAHNGQSPNAAAQLLSFSKPTSRVRETLLSVARDPSADYQKAGEAYETLFMLELDDAKVRREVMEKIAWRDERHTRAALASDLLIRGSARWAMAELRDTYTQFLSVPLKPENYPKRGGRPRLVGDYNIAITALKAFGASARDFESLLKARLAEMNPTQDADLINSCQETLLIIRGEVNPIPVCNWKGQLLGVSRTVYTVASSAILGIRRRV
jgi:hypothetical protein